MGNNRGSVALLILMVLFMLCLMAGGLLHDKSAAIKALDVQGYSDVRILDHKWFAVSVRGCGRSDLSRFDAEVTNPRGKRVRVFVCIGAFKGATVRSE